MNCLLIVAALINIVCSYSPVVIGKYGYKFILFVSSQSAHDKKKKTKSFMLFLADFWLLIL